MASIHKNILLIYDDREIASEEIRSVVGPRRYGSIIFKSLTLVEHFYTASPSWIRDRIFHLRSEEDLILLRAMLDEIVNMPILVISARAVFSKPEMLTQLIERLPYAEENFTDTLSKPNLVWMRDSRDLIKQWSAFASQPFHAWEKTWSDTQRLNSALLLDLSKIQDFLSYTSGSTSARHFNQVEIDRFYCTKRSTDKAKMIAEYSFYSLVPENVRPWLVESFDFQDEGDFASYKMQRYYLADAALQWVHGAFDADAFSSFIDRLLFFISVCPKSVCAKNESAAMAQDIFVNKVRLRIKDFLSKEEGQHIDKLVKTAMPQLAIESQFKRYLNFYHSVEKNFVFDYKVLGHGDPCLSNILYDHHHHLLKFIDPRGAMCEKELLMHPLYDLCKISHSVLGDYDFINNGLYDIRLNESNQFFLRLTQSNQAEMKEIFIKRIKAIGIDIRTMRLCEVSLFLSMLPLHIDNPNKVIAFMLKANEIMDEVESE